MVGQQGRHLWSGSAQLYWGRLAALLLRLLYYAFPEVDWGFVFVDDFCWILRSTNCNSLTPAVLAFLVALGVPLSWKKTVLSEINTWLGFVINPAGPFVQMARDKHVIVLSLLKDLASGKVFSTKAIEKALGRIQWATATCPLAKPFLQPFWQWKSACKNAGQPGKLVRCLALRTFLPSISSDVSLLPLVQLDESRSGESPSDSDSCRFRLSVFGFRFGFRLSRFSTRSCFFFAFGFRFSAFGFRLCFFFSFRLPVFGFWLSVYIYFTHVQT